MSGAPEGSGRETAQSRRGRSWRQEPASAWAARGSMNCRIERMRNDILKWFDATACFRAQTIGTTVRLAGVRRKSNDASNGPREADGSTLNWQPGMIGT